MSELAALVTACSLLVLYNVYREIWKRMGLPTDPRRLVKWAVVSYRQSSAHDRINGALFVSVVVVALWAVR